MSFLEAIDADFAASLEASGSGARVPSVTCQIEFPLLPEHLAGYLNEHGQLQTTQKADEKDVQVLRAKHHSVARLLAEGIPEVVVAEMTGYDRNHISKLKQAPSMVELISHYRSGPNEAAKLIGEKLRSVGTQALGRLEGMMEKLGPQELLSLAKLGFDRSGHGPQSSVTTVTEHRLIDVTELAKIAQEARRRDADLIVPVNKVREVLPAPSKEADDGLGS